MAYAIDNPVKKISQMGPSNSLWYYTDGDAIGTIDDDNYFILSHAELKVGDIIFVNSGSNAAVDILMVSVNDGGTNLNTVLLA